MASDDAPMVETGRFDGKLGCPLFYRWHPVAEPRAVAVIVHGLAEHSGRYLHVIEHLNGLGVACLAFDNRGHGQSDGRRVFVNRFGEYVEDTRRAVTEAKGRAPGVPCFLLGHSMGGVIVLATVLDHGLAVDGAIVSSPGLAAAIKVPAWKDLLGKALSKVWPTLGIPTGIPASAVSRDAAVVAAYEADPLVTKSATARWYTEYLDAQERVIAGASRITTPTLWLIAGKDKLVDPAVSQTVFGAVPEGDKQLQLYPELYHEILNEPEQAAVLADIDAWLTPRLASADA